MLLKTFSTLPVITLLLAAAVFSCTKTNFDETGFKPHEADVAFPLFQTEISTDDLLPSILNDSLPGDTLIYNADKTVTLIYSGDVAESKATDIFTTWFKQGVAPVSDTLFYSPIDAPDSLHIYQANLNDGTIQLTVINSTPDTLQGWLEIPQMTMNGQVFKIPFFVLPMVGGNFGYFLSESIPIAGWELRSTDNTLFFRYYAYKNDGTRVKIPEATGFPGVFLIFNNMAFSYLEGYWGQQIYPLDRDTIEIDINKTEIKGDVKVVNPRVWTTVENSFGFPTRGIVRYLRFLGKDGIEYELESPYAEPGTGIDFAYPSHAAGEVGQTKYSEFYFDKNNSNIDEIFNAQPTRMIYEIDGFANAQNDTSLIGFLTNESKVKFGLRVEMTLEGSVRDFGADQEIDLDFGEIGDLDPSEIGDIEFKLVTENEMPMAVEMQVYFQKENGAVIDSLFAGGLKKAIKAAPVDADGRAIGSAREETFIAMDVARFNRLKNAKKGSIKSFFTTTDNGNVPVKVLSGAKVKVKMGVRVKAKFE